MKNKLQKTQNLVPYKKEIIEKEKLET